jgi:acetyl-CoA carboxylase carboxyl transferase subunit alpha
MENSYYSVISPEGCAAILWNDRGKAKEAATALRLSSSGLLEFDIVDGIVEEPIGGAHNDYDLAAAALKKTIGKALADLRKLDIKTLLDLRYRRFRKFGVFAGSPPGTENGTGQSKSARSLQ